MEQRSSGLSLVERASLKLGKLVTGALLRRPLHIDPPRALVSFTFDDFPVTAYRTGGSILQRHGVRGTYYAAFGMLGGESEGQAMMTQADITALLAEGHELGCHTFSHISARGLGRAQLAREFDDNLAALAKVTGLSNWSSFSYPFGDVTLRVKRVARDRFTTCRTTQGGLNHGSVDLAALRSYPLSSRFDPVERTLAQIQEARQKRAWLIFFTHDVAEKHATYGCTPEHLEAAVSAAIAAGCDVVTVGEAARRLGAA